MADPAGMPGPRAPAGPHQTFNREPPPGNLDTAKRPASLRSALTTLLTRNNVDSRVQDWLSAAGCHSVAEFSNWVDDRKDLHQAVLSKLPAPLRDSNAQLACLKQAWREAEAENARTLKRTHELAEAGVDPDTPLEPSYQKEVESAFRALYNWPALPANRVGSDSLLGRVQREFERRTPAQYPVSRVRSLAFSQRGVPTKVRRLSAGVTLSVYDAAEEHDDEPAGLHTFLSQLSILATTWSVAGCFEAELGTDTGEKAVFCHWAEATSYTQVFEERAYAELPLHTEESVTQWISHVESEMRTRAIELVRGTERLLWGRALVRALRDLSSLWSETRHLLQCRRPPGNFSVPPPPTLGKAQTMPPVRSAPVGANHRKWMHSAATAAGAAICKRFNDQRGCKGTCPTGKLHACDVTVATGSACGRKDHCRLGHDPAKHGAPKLVGSGAKPAQHQ